MRFVVIHSTDTCTTAPAREQIVRTTHWAYFGYTYLDRRVTFCLLARLASTPKLGLAPLPNMLRVGHTTIIIGLVHREGALVETSSVARALLERFSSVPSSVFGRFGACEQ